jgi:hypothetical protein
LNEINQLRGRAKVPSKAKARAPAIKPSPEADARVVARPFFGLKYSDKNGEVVVQPSQRAAPFGGKSRAYTTVQEKINTAAQRADKYLDVTNYKGGQFAVGSIELKTYTANPKLATYGNAQYPYIASADPNAYAAFFREQLGQQAPAADVPLGNLKSMRGGSLQVPSTANVIIRQQ